MMGKILELPSGRKPRFMRGFGKKGFFRLPDYSQEKGYILSDARHVLWQLRDEGLINAVFEVSIGVKDYALGVDYYVAIDEEIISLQFSTDPRIKNAKMNHGIHLVAVDLRDKDRAQKFPADIREEIYKKIVEIISLL